MPAVTFLGRNAFRFRSPRRIPTILGKILLLKTGALGDVLMTTPLIQTLHQRFPHARLDYAVGAWSAPALHHNPHISSLITFEDRLISRRQILPLLRLAKSLRKNHYDLVFVLDRAWQANVFARLLNAATIGFDRLGEGFALDKSVRYGEEPHLEAPHDVITYLQLAQLVGAKTPQNPTLIAPVNPADVKKIKNKLQSLPRPLIALAPGGAHNPYQTMPARRWPVEYYSRLIDRLLQQNYGVVLLGSRHDQPITQQTIRKLHAPHSLKNNLLDLTGLTTFSEAGTCLKWCDAAVLHDSALLHLASAVKTPTLALFGPTNPKRKGPWGNRHRLIWNQNNCASSLNRYQPCQWENRPPICHDQHCMRAIDVTQALRQLSVLL